MPTSPDSELRFIRPCLKRWLVFGQSSRMFLSRRRRFKPLRYLMLGVATLMGAGIGSASFTVSVDLPFIILFLFVLYAIGGPVAAVPAMIVPAVILFSLILQPIIKRVSLISAEQGRTKQAVIVEMIGALETVKTTQGNSMLRNRWLHSVMLHARGWAKGKLTSQLA